MVRAGEQTDELIGYSLTEFGAKRGGPVKAVRKKGEEGLRKLVIPEPRMGATMGEIIEDEYPELIPEVDDQARERLVEVLTELTREEGLRELIKSLDSRDIGIDVMGLDKDGQPIFRFDPRTASIDVERLANYLERYGYDIPDVSNAALVVLAAKKKRKIDLRKGLPDAEAKRRLSAGVRIDTEVVQNRKDKEFVEEALRKHPNLLADLLTSEEAATETIVRLFPSGGKKPARVVISGKSGGEVVSLSLTLDQWRLCLKAQNTPVILPDIKAKEGENELVRTFEGPTPILQIRRDGQVVEEKKVNVAEPTAEEAKSLADWQLAVDSLTVEGKRSSVKKFEIMRRVKRK